MEQQSCKTYRAYFGAEICTNEDTDRRLSSNIMIHLHKSKEWVLGADESPFRRAETSWWGLRQCLIRIPSTHVYGLS